MSQPISLDRVREHAEAVFGDMVKLVVDLDKDIMALGGELHADEEAVLLKNGSKHENLWGANIYPDMPKDKWLEYDSMINIRPSQGNRSREIGDKNIRDQVKQVIEGLII